MKLLGLIASRVGPALLCLAACAHGGFDIPRHGVTAVALGGTQSDKDFLDGADIVGIPYPPINEPIPPADLAKLKAHRMFAGKTDAQIQDKVVNMRRAVLCAIELINKEDARIGEGMRRLFRAGKLCIGLGKDNYRVAAEILTDGKAEFNMEPVNFYLLPCERLKASSPLLFDLANTIGHEGLHGVQEVSPWRDGQTMAQAKNIQCRELEASEAEYARAVEMLRILAAIDNRGQLPADARGMYASIGSALIAEFRGNPAGLSAAIAEFRTVLERIKLRAEEVAEFRRLYKRAAELAIAGSPATAAVLDGLRKHRLFQNTGTTNEFAPITRYYISRAPDLTETPGQPPTIQGGPGMRQIVPPETTPRDFTCPFVDSLCDAAVVEDASGNATGIFLGGIHNATAKGVLVHAGIGADGYIIPASAQKIYESASLNDGFNLDLNPYDNKLYATSLADGAIVRFDDLNGDGLFEVGVSSGGFAGLPSDLIALNFETTFTSRDRLTARLCDPDCLRSVDEPVFETERTGPGGDFMPRPVYPFYENFLTTPSVEGALYPGSSLLALAGTPGAAFSVRIGGAMPVTLATGMLSPFGRERLVVSAAKNDQLFVVMAADGSTLQVPMDQPPLFPTLEISGLGGGGTINLSARAPAGSMVNLFHTDLGMPPSKLPVGVPGYSDMSSRYSLTVPADSLAAGSAFFRAEVTAPVLPSGAHDSFRATPGLNNVFDVSLNDGMLPPGTWFELGTRPDLPESLFQFHGDGSFKIIPRNASGPLNFTYRIHLGSLVSPFLNVVVLRDISTLTNPRVIESSRGPLVAAWMLEASPEEDFPLYQFLFAFSIFDECGLPHWHALGFVFSLDEPAGLLDPDLTSCGFGWYPDLEPYSIFLSLEEWNAFRSAHP